MRHLRLIVPVERMVCVADDTSKCDPHCVNHIGAVMGRSENCSLPGYAVAIVDGNRIRLCVESETKS